VTGPLKIQSANTSELRCIGVRESENRVSRHHECRNRDRRSPDKVKEGSVLIGDRVSGFQETYTRPLDL
jgi:hypothetical protein